MLVRGKASFFVTGPFWILHSICLNIGSWRVILYGSVAFEIDVYLTERPYPSFLKKIFPFPENFVLKLKYSAFYCVKSKIKSEFAVQFVGKSKSSISAYLIFISVWLMFITFKQG